MDDANDDVAYDATDALIDAALRQDPGYVLPRDLAARVLARTHARATFDWPTYVLFPSALLLAFAAGVLFLPTRLGSAGAQLSEFWRRGAEDLPLRSLSYAAAALLFTLLIDRLLAARLRAHRPER